MSEQVQITRCRDCMWYGNNWVSKLGSLCTNSKLRTQSEHIFVDPDFFCAYGQTLDDGLKK
jgi:hypothetical protein